MRRPRIPQANGRNYRRTVRLERTGLHLCGQQLVPPSSRKLPVEGRVSERRKSRRETDLPQPSVGGGARPRLWGRNRAELEACGAREGMNRGAGAQDRSLQANRS